MTAAAAPRCDGPDDRDARALPRATGRIASCTTAASSARVLCGLCVTSSPRQQMEVSVCSLSTTQLLLAALGWLVEPRLQLHSLHLQWSLWTAASRRPPCWSRSWVAPPPRALRAPTVAPRRAVLSRSSPWSASSVSEHRGVLACVVQALIHMLLFVNLCHTCLSFVLIVCMSLVLRYV